MDCPDVNFEDIFIEHYATYILKRISGPICFYCECTESPLFRKTTINSKHVLNLFKCEAINVIACNKCALRIIRSPKICNKCLMPKTITDENKIKICQWCEL